jgi:hypothetical protein
MRVSTSSPDSSTVRFTTGNPEASTRSGAHAWRAGHAEAPAAVGADGERERDKLHARAFHGMALGVDDLAAAEQRPLLVALGLRRLSRGRAREANRLRDPHRDDRGRDCRAPAASWLPRERVRAAVLAGVVRAACGWAGHHAPACPEGTRAARHSPRSRGRRRHPSGSAPLPPVAGAAAALSAGVRGGSGTLWRILGDEFGDDGAGVRRVVAQRARGLCGRPLHVVWDAAHATRRAARAQPPALGQRDADDFRHELRGEQHEAASTEHATSRLRVSRRPARSRGVRLGGRARDVETRALRAYEAAA